MEKSKEHSFKFDFNTDKKISAISYANKRISNFVCNYLKIYGQYLVMVNVSLWQTRTYIVRFKKKHNNANRTCPVTVVLGAGFANRLVFVMVWLLQLLFQMMTQLLWLLATGGKLVVMFLERDNKGPLFYCIHLIIVSDCFLSCYWASKDFLDR